MQKGGHIILKIAFWSNVHGKSGVTSNLACISVMSVLMKKRRHILFENHFNLNNLERMLNESLMKEVIKEYDLYYRIGMEQLIRQLHSGYQLETAIKSSSLTFMDDCIYYLPQNYFMNQEIFDYELNTVLPAMFQLMDKTGYDIYIDTEVNKNLTSKVILEEADMVVVNLTQNPYILEDFFSNYGTITKKAVYLIGNYNSESKYNSKYIQKKYQIEKNKIAVIPYNVHFQDAMTDGRLIGFLNQIFKCNRKSENYYFMNEVKKAVTMIEKNCIAQEDRD